MEDTLLTLSDEDLKDILRLGFAFGGLEAAKLASLDDFAFLIRRHAFAAFLEVLESAEQVLRPPA